MGSEATLSKGLLTMKFMQKSREKIEKAKEAQESQQMYASEITDEMKKELLFITEPSRGACEDIVKGRFSFGGVNPHVELLMAEEEAALASKNDINNETCISDENMAKHYSNKEKFSKYKQNSFYKSHKSRHKPYKKPIE